MLKKRIKICIFIFIFSLTSVFAKGDRVLEEFNKQLDSIGLVFTMPPNFKPTSIIENDDVLYYYAIKHVSKKVEIRYSIFPYKKAIKEPGHVEVGTDNMHKEFTYMVVANIAGDDKNIDSFKYMQDDMVKNNFNADYGYMALVTPQSGYGKGYKKTLIVGLYKSGFGFSYHTILYDKNNADENIMPQLYSVRFKDKK